jgi:hypothetical protein
MGISFYFLKWSVHWSTEAGFEYGTNGRLIGLGFLYMTRKK